MLYIALSINTILSLYIIFQLVCCSIILISRKEGDIVSTEISSQQAKELAKQLYRSVGHYIANNQQQYLEFLKEETKKQVKHAG